MELSTVVIVALALGTDAFSMAVGIGMGGIRRREIYVVAGVISLFHVFMPLLGLYLGCMLGRAVGQWAGLIGAVVLILIGVLMLREAWQGSVTPVSGKPLSAGGGQTQIHVFSGVWGLTVLAGSVSLDALTVGFGLGTLRANLALTVLIMGMVAGVMTVAGFLLGRRLGGWLGEKAQAAGGLVLVFIGVRMLMGG